MNRAFTVVLVVAAIALESAPAQALVGTIAGVVKDPAGALIPAAQITILQSPPV